MRGAGFLPGALAGALLTAPLIAVFFLFWRAAGLPFVPFDLFDRVARVLPGPLITVVIDVMVAIIRGLNLGSTSTVAKAAEQTMAVLTFWLVGIVASAVLFTLLRRREPAGAGPGLVAGAALGVPLGWIGAAGRTASVPPAVSFLWVLAALLVWGTALAWARRRLAHPAGRGAAPRVEALNRRQFLVRLAGASATVTVVGAAVGALPRGRRRQGPALSGRWSASHPLPNAGAVVKPAPGTRPEFTSLESHYRIDINTVPPTIAEEGWRLRVGGAVEQPTALTLAHLRDRYAPTHQFVTLSCISNRVAGDLISTTRWTGVSLQRILADVRPRPNATHLKMTSADGFYEVVDLKVIAADPRVMLTYAWDGVPLPREHGFPLRIYIPDHYGMKQPKWITSMELLDHWEAGYWVARGWDREARMRATSVIDTVATNMVISEAGPGMRVPIGGIAHAGARGISRVQVKVDNGPWEDTHLRTPLSATTWVLWRYDWPFQAGKHTFVVRCFEGDGTPQIAEENPIHPSGATGLHSESVML